VNWCVANATATTLFCTDFDEGKPYGFGFTSYLNLPDGGVPPSLVTTDFVSAPNSLLVPTAIVPPSGSEQVQLVVHTGNHPQIQLQFALKLVDYDVSAGDLSLVRIAFESNSWWVSWDLQGSGGAFVFETSVADGGQQTTIMHPTTFPTLGEWVNVVYAVDVDAKTVSLSFNGTSALQDAITPPALGSGGVSVGVGLNYLQGTQQAMSIYYDNVAITEN
jgi:hypothetical protein